MADSPISILKKLFTDFFQRMDRGYYDKIFKTKGRFSNYDPKKEWYLYTQASKATVLGIAQSVTSLGSVIGQTGVDAFNTWLATYAVGDGALSQEALTELKKWYDQYLKPLS